jgi:hypothetical protein
MEIERFLLTQFCDKGDILLKVGFHPTHITPTQAKIQLSSIEDLRNHIAHASDIALPKPKHSKPWTMSSRLGSG